MNVKKQLDLIKQVGEEIITEQDLMNLLETKKNPVAYDGFEPSGNMHIAQGVLRSININKLTEAGIRFKMLVADWHGWANNKMGGDLEKIQVVGKYMIEIWKACGMNLDNVEFIWANDFVKDINYWKKVMKVSRHTTVNRIIRCAQIMGRSEKGSLQSSQILYPCMQCVDIFHLGADITQLGMDQRKVNMLAREVGPALGYWKPVVISHHMLMGLGLPPKSRLAAERAIELKMSKSKPYSAIFMTDTEEDIMKKLNKAHCPPGTAEENPIMEYSKYLVFEQFKKMEVERDVKFGGDIEFNNYEELESEYTKGELHPQDLKHSVARYINKMIFPVRKHFDKNKKARELLEQVNSFQVTR